MNTADKSFGFTDEGIEEIVLDSRKKMHNALFVPIVGERSDGHDYIDMAIANGAVAVLSSRDTEALQEKYPNVKFYRVPDTKAALQEIGYMERLKFSGKVVGVTGSVGKTTTRNMIATALSAGMKVFQTAGNANSQVGVPITMFQMARSCADIAVIELGMSEPGEMTKIARIACVDIAVITNIGIAHIEYLKTQENILREKLHILDGASGQAVLYINSKDAILRELSIEKIHEFGIAEDTSLVIKSYSPDDYALTLITKGDHMLQNASAAMHICEDNDVDLDGAKAKLESFTGVAGRGETFRTEKGVLIIDDAYNASPVSMKAGLDTLSQLEGSRKIAVLADMLELGEKTLDYHREVGTYIATLPIDVVFLYGEKAASIGAGINAAFDMSDKDSGKSRKPTIEYFNDFTELNNTIRSVAKDGDVILFKGSNSMKLSEIVNTFKQEKI
ncbi:UDP-N-acetylmuramoyl-tripeptide--D-alanyl-D-alanine ligase [Oribacterium sp. WCC10]|uniref:UDP-N-acetylmuramoyl-tripeptide--D-alanyl-D- alanine ligase n=1 Tax=Oribacterium sp. WCC10 TaxID=1855343 RepID=UPI0008E40F23|nr:UDP-N-acetylmuramoyl-tripeptide--D-alanyl-D-alanine ligase [Oribacterium sp. WCC10]SFG56521.1 UDP-N-acetylmuramoyl-tripeptide--D-alanyl-D-alanine ligase [Oribacterium sp. WCC10]